MLVLLFVIGITGADSLVERQFFLIQENKSWNDSQTYCREHYSDLATIHSDADMGKLQAEAQKYQFTGEAWLGLYKELHQWSWSYKNESLGNGTFWDSGQPNNGDDKEECILQYIGLWADYPCDWTYNFVCYDERYIGGWGYIFINDSKSWYDAQSYCRLHHTDLASMRDPSEQFLFVDYSTYTWIGLSRITWKWLDQTDQANVTWEPGQPDNALSFEDCGYLSNFQAADAQCSELKPFFCFAAKRKIQTLRLKVESDQNLKDPAVKAALLEKILHKLKENGIIMLKWRETPGGDIFNKIKS